MTGIMKWIPRIHTAPFLPPGINKTDELEDPTTPPPSFSSRSSLLQEARPREVVNRWKPPCISSSIDSQRRLKLVEKSNSEGCTWFEINWRSTVVLFIYFFSFNLYCSLFSRLDVDGIDLLGIFFESISRNKIQEFILNKKEKRKSTVNRFKKL